MWFFYFEESLVVLKMGSPGISLGERLIKPEVPRFFLFSKLNLDR